MNNKKIALILILAIIMSFVPNTIFANATIENADAFTSDESIQLAAHAYEDEQIYSSMSQSIEVQTDQTTYDSTKSNTDISTIPDIETGLKNINIYITWGSLPTLYALLNAYDDASPSYMWYLRGGTADPEKLPEHITMMTNVVNGNTSLTKDLLLYFQAYIKKIYEANPDAKFNLYTDDLRVQAEFQMLTYNGIPVEQYTMTLLSDGTGSYQYFNDLYYTNENPSAQWDKCTNWFNGLVAKAANGELLEDGLNNNMQYAYCSYSRSAEDNYEYWIQWPELMVCTQEEANVKLATMNMIKKLPNDMYAAFDEETKAAFLNAVGIDKSVWDTMYFPNVENGEKYLIVSGTSPNGEKAYPFEVALKNIIRDYGSEYKIYYKPHPSWPAKNVSGRVELLEQYNITELPAQLPMECILWAYPNVKIGGYNSSLYMSATTKGQVAFFITNAPTSLSDPLPGIYKLGYYEGCKFYFVEDTVGYVDSINLSDNGIQITNTLRTTNEDGTQNLKMTFTNSEDNNDKAVTVWFAIYSRDGVLESVQSKTISADNLTAEFVNISADFDSTVKLFVWSNEVTPSTKSLTGLDI